MVGKTDLWNQRVKLKQLTELEFRKFDEASIANNCRG